jgi:hypothetical protein
MIEMDSTAQPKKNKLFGGKNEARERRKQITRAASKFGAEEIVTP